VNQTDPTDASVVIFAKAPVAGAVKTRLAATIGAEEACAVYVALLARTVRRLDGGGPWETLRAVTPDEAVATASLWPDGPARLPQGAGDLGARMARALARAVPARPVVVVGSDIPDLDARHAAEAVAALAEADLAFGRAADGGFWLVGARRQPPPGLFAGVRWSGPHALAETLANAAGLRVALLTDTLTDIDEAVDYARLLARESDFMRAPGRRAGPAP
jgi:rSAM/selenodomain-associated transferase 1